MITNCGVIVGKVVSLAFVIVHYYLRKRRAEK